MAVSTPKKALLGAPPAKKPVAAEALVSVAKTHGVSPVKQFGHQLKRMYGPKKSKLRSIEYYEYQLYRPELTAAERLEFIGNDSNLVLNQSLSNNRGRINGAIIEQKALFSALMDGLGLAMTKMQAVVSHGPAFGDMRTLRTAEDVAAFLRDDARYPVFGKPVEGSKSVGSALFQSHDPETGLITFGNGQTHDAAALAKEIFDDYPEGYLLQDAVTQHGDMRALAGDAVGSVRMVTVHDATGAHVLYTLWKIPSPAAMSDNFWQDGSMLAHIDANAGKVTQCRRGVGLNAEDIETHPVSAQPIVGFKLPHWEAARKLVMDTHSVFPDLGVIGWDVGISADGPVIIEGNLNPFHTLYQIATGRGVNNPEFVAVFDQIRAHQANQLKVQAAAQKAYLERHTKT
ncbi:sugar-transfer associated ATP-grasp domain-containing protein [Yoonia sp. SS1-5]|uniref:Sugar-transfer associated ATP-grasp domain-containing protein n=1 Tax=Yoonia rhodophyticola TaxID=3137370 RepID=A0AAN0MHS2_9RHOB